MALSGLSGLSGLATCGRALTVHTFQIASAYDDAYIYRGGASFPPAGSYANGSFDASIVACNQLSGGTYMIQIPLLRWGTSSLAGKTIVAAKIRLYIGSVSNADSRSLTIGYYAWGGSAESTDWTSTARTDAHSGTALGSLASGGQWNEFTLSSLGSISKSGYTEVSCHVDGGAPAGLNSYAISSYDSGSRKPELLVTTVA